MQDVLAEIGTAGVVTRRGVAHLFESQLAALTHVARELANAPLNQRLRALTQATIGVLAPLLTSVEQSNREAPPPSIERCRQSIGALAPLIHP